MIQLQNLKILGISLAFAAGLVACDGSVADYVKVDRPILQDRNVGPGAVGGSLMKVSPGQMHAGSPDVYAVGKITTTNKFLTSGAISAVVTVSQTRSKKQ